MTCSFQKAFTLVELLVVIVTIAVLFLLFGHPTTQAKIKAKRAQCANNLRQIGIGMHNFVAEKGVFPPLISNTKSDNPGTWVSLIQTIGLGASNPHTNYYNEGIWRCPSLSVEDADGERSYGYNAFGAGSVRTAPLGLAGRYDTNALFVPIRESEVATPSDMFAVADSLNGGIMFTRVGSRNSRKATDRHGGAWDVLFCDGHVLGCPLKAVFVETNDTALARWNRDHHPHREVVIH